uniref:Uncharacterized protein n=1 Tax=Chromera velia CCMP2878 TaxID=1169474 RepID=A0A0G4F4Q6_9ALVE|eukprot:Cvel_15070.t1-p1 / transcript=Cvel_15070.t1 / gene=Cvel_15070 / organism=Chromera_velia_CCMP2878 / gene_product=hypothetical protein / transcript_product=hypothetical protein / location=Cvel_scaffold1098:36708-37160(-) / protein_length=151 / sequence_SO=supercontig / SO=protein_coding / is_pseudo=false
MQHRCAPMTEEEEATYKYLSRVYAERVTNAAEAVPRANPPSLNVSLPSAAPNASAAPHAPLPSAMPSTAPNPSAAPHAPLPSAMPSTAPNPSAAPHAPLLSAMLSTSPKASAAPHAPLLSATPSAAEAPAIVTRGAMGTCSSWRLVRALVL